MCLCGNQKMWLTSWWILSLFNGLVLFFAYVDGNWMYRVHWNEAIKQSRDPEEESIYIKSNIYIHKAELSLDW